MLGLQCQVRTGWGVSCAASILKRTLMASSSSKESLDEALQKAADAVRNAKALIVTAGAGMGVDSGLPDFRGAQGFWKAYPLLKDKGIHLSAMSNPEWFENDPTFAWWFFGHRYNMYSSTEPHHGFQILKDWGDKMEQGYFVFTSNVDGHFQKAGFDADRVVECHGSINFMQNYDEQISHEIWPVPEGTKYELDMDTMKIISPLPTGPPGAKQQYPARPNILMFGDWSWIGRRTEAQEHRKENFQRTLNKHGGIPFAVIEIGAGLAVPTVRYQSETLVNNNKGVLIRINPNEPEVPRGNISVPMKGLEALQRIKDILDSAGMGVDSGLPDFRGAQGFWKAYPLLKDKGIHLSAMSNPEWFASDPTFAWWFFAHRYNMYSSTEPHQGFNILNKWANKMEHGYFVFTSNVDGHFQKAGFDTDRVVECHGSINFMQTYDKQISNEIWPVSEGTKYELDMDTMKIISPLPTGPPGSTDQHAARPNIKMFGDWFWISHRTGAQHERFRQFQMSLMKDGGVPFAVIEIGAGLDVPTVRQQSESLVGRNKGVHIRINPNEPQVPKWPKNSVSLPMKGLEALQRIQEILDSSE